MKAHFATFMVKEILSGKKFYFQGLVTGLENNGKVVIDPLKIIKRVFDYQVTGDYMYTQF